MKKAEDLVLELMALEKAAELDEFERGKFHAKLCEKHSAPDLYAIGADALSRLVRSIKFMDKAMLRDWFEFQFQSSHDEEIETYIEELEAEYSKLHDERHAQQDLFGGGLL